MYGTNTNDTAESGLNSEYKRWLTFWEKRKCNNPSTAQNTMTEYFKVLNEYLASEQQIGCQETNEFRGNWSLKGPKHLPTQTQGIISSIWASPNNPKIILAGSAFGGLWKKDGNNEWKNLTDNATYLPGTIGVACIAVDNNDNDKIFLGTGLGPRMSFNWEGAYGFGIVYTIDGGLSWTQDVTFLQAVSPGGWPYEFPYVDKIVLLPNTTKLVALYKNKILEKDVSNMANGWVDVTPTIATAGTKYNDIVIKEGITNGYFVSTVGSASEIWEHESSGSWIKINTGVTFNIGANNYNAEAMDGYIIASSNNNLFAYVSKGVTTCLAKYNYSTTTWSVVYNFTWEVENLFLTSTGGTADLAVPINNDNVVYCGFLKAAVLISTDGGVSYTMHYIGDNLINNNVDPDHADNRCIYISNSTNTTNGIMDEVFYGNDGGVTIKPTGNDPLVLGANTVQPCDDEGLAITQLYGFDVSEKDELIAGGVMHNGMCTYNKKRMPQWAIPVGYNNGDWKNSGVGDGYNAEFDKQNRELVYGAHNEPYMTYYDFTINNSANWTHMQAPPGTDKDVLNVRPIDIEESSNQLQIGSKTIYGATSGALPNLGYTDLFSNGSTVNINFPITEKVRIYKVAPAPNENYKYVYFNGIGDFHLWRVNLNLSPSYLDITPQAAKGQFAKMILDMAIDPKNPNKLWVCFGDIEPGGNSNINCNPTNRVMLYDASQINPVSNDNWFCKSEGLPNLPINCIKYQNGSDDILYVGSDVGVFIYDKTNEKWNPFNKMKDVSNVNNICMPKIIVEDLDINYCTGKLFSATHGRAIWESDLYIPNNNPGITNEIVTNSTWTGDKYIEGSIKVTASHTLTITGTTNNPTTIHLPKYGKIIVEKGAKLIIDGATLTNSCDAMWTGIYLEADPSLRQISTSGGYYTQGYCEIKNGAIIENSENGIANYNDGTLGGGIIMAYNSIFKNNRRSLEFMKYQNKNSVGTPIADRSVFSKCTFEVNDDMHSQTPFAYHVSMWGIDGINFYGCAFKNLQTDANVPNQKGIYSIDANYNLKSACGNSNTYPCNAILPNTFDNFDNAVESMGWSQYRPIVSDQTVFTGNQYGVLLNAVNSPVLTRNKFAIGSVTSPGWFTLPYGIAMYETPDFRMEENEFIGNGQSSISLGLWLQNCVNDNVVYKNKFKDLTYGNISLGDRYESNPGHVEHGLKYACNTQDGNTYHMLQFDNTNTNSGGINKHQNYQYHSVGNTFENSSIVNYSDIYNLSSIPIDYFHSGGITEPVGYNWPMVNVYSVTANSCYSHIGEVDDPTNLNDGLSTTKSAYYLLSADYNTVLYNYVNLLDGGNTEEFINELIETWGEGIIALRSQLLSESPFVTTEALHEVAENNMLPPSLLLEVLLANPNATKDLSFLEYLQYEKPNPMSESMIELIQDSWQSDTYRDALERTLSELNRKQNGLCNQIIHSILTDSTRTEYDSIPNWIYKIGTPSSRYDLVEFYLSLNDTTQARAALNAIPNDFSLGDSETRDLYLYDSLFDFIMTLKRNNREINQLDSPEIAKLQVIANALPNSLASQRAQNALCFFYHLCVPHISTVEITENKRRTKTSLKTQESIRVYPNPSHDFITFDYHNMGQAKMNSLVLTDLTGKKFRFENLESSPNQFILDVRNINAGTYIYTIINSIGEKYSGKITIQK